jgi:putative membrane-bound dehydrogenase-like protein
VGQASSLPVDEASLPRRSSGKMPPEPADKMSAPHFQAGAHFGVIRADGRATVFYRSELGQGAWHFDGSEWVEDKTFFRGLELDGQPVRTREGGRDRGVRLRDVNNDGRCELIVGNERQNAVFTWSDEETSWKRLPYALPPGSAIVNEQGRDNGLRFVDLNHDGFDDVLFSNEKAYSVHLFVPMENRNVDWLLGWTQEFRSGKRGDPDEVPMIVRGGEHPNNGVWFKRSTMWVQNEDTAHLPDQVDRRPFEALLTESGPPPKSPAESLAAIRVRAGFKVELVAHEPLVMDPVAFDWGADGKLWVVEMGDYPRGVDDHGKFGGVVRFLEDADGDGRYDRSTVFLEGLGFPNGVMPWRNGVLVSCAPDILYAEDTDGDGKADVRKALFTGFAKGNQQHRVNGFEYGLDNWIYGANGDSGGEVTSASTGKTSNISGRDFRFRPDTGAFETETGHTQFGRHRDDWGNWFGNNNSSWGWHDLVPERYLRRNPHLAVRATVREYATYPDARRLYPASRALRRFNWPGAVNTVTSACSASPYRDELFGSEFASSLFICEPVHNVVHREVLAADGVTFTSHRANDEQSGEFLASADNWSRFVFCKTGPDGALYIADMYRLVIEHPEWIPAEVQKRLDLRAGHDQGRIYRVYPEDSKLRPIPRLDKLNTAGLVAALDTPNGWQRDTAQRLLVQAFDSAAVKPLAALLAKSPNPKVRLQALCTLDGLEALTPAIIETAAKDKHPAVREQAARVGETLLSKSPEVATSLLRLVDDPEIRVRYQLAFSLGEWNDPRAGVTLAKLAVHDFDNPQMRIAVMSSAARQVGPMLAGILSDRRAAPPADVLEQLVNLAVALDDRDALVKALGEIAKPVKEDSTAWRFSAIAGFLDGLERRGLSLKAFHDAAQPELKEAIQRLDRLFAEARNVATDPRAGETERLSAIRLAGRGLDAPSQETESLGALLRPQEPLAIQQAALAGLGRGSGERVAGILLAGWRGYSPMRRAEVLGILFRRQEWISALLRAVERGEIAAGQISAAYQQKLLGHSQEAIRERAAKLFTATDSDRQRVVKQYEGVSDLAGDATRGRAIYQQTCSVCHRLKGEGNEAGPDLGSMADKPAAQLLEAILDPNRAVEARYFSYTAVTQSGRETSGIIAVETPNSITLKTATGSEEVILRSDLKQLTASGLSLMPEGLENSLKPQDLADVIAYIKTSGNERP